MRKRSRQSQKQTVKKIDWDEETDKGKMNIKNLRKTIWELRTGKKGKIWTKIIPDRLKNPARTYHGM